MGSWATTTTPEVFASRTVPVSAQYPKAASFIGSGKTFLHFSRVMSFSLSFFGLPAKY